MRTIRTASPLLIKKLVWERKKRRCILEELRFLHAHPIRVRGEGVGAV